MYLDASDFVVCIVFFILIYFWSRNYLKKRIDERPEYKYFQRALFLKILGGIGVCMIYDLYYGGGDTLYYYIDSSRVSDLFVTNPVGAIKFSFSPFNNDIYMEFIRSTVPIPLYNYDERALFVVKVTWALNFIAFQSYAGQTTLLAALSFIPLWKLYLIFTSEFPMLKKQLAFAFFFIPSVFFWGSGLLKDTITLAATAMFTVCLYNIIKRRHRVILSIALIIYSGYLLSEIKPYILFALLPGSAIWIFISILNRVNSRLLKNILTPVLIIFAVGFSVFMFNFLGTSLGDYSADKVLNKAVVTQQDLKREAYGGASFDIGEFDPSLGGILAKAPLAINAALFRPYIWEARNAVMILSGLENLTMLLFTIYLLIQLKIYNFFRLMFQNNLLVFSLLFSLFFAFSVGLTTSNFGSLVRYKIPAMPFYVTMLVIIYHYYRTTVLMKDQEKSIMETELRSIK